MTETKKEIETKDYYGENYDKYCSCSKELDCSKASDVSFGEFTSDVIGIWCPSCGIVEVFSY